jgi:DNA-binding transcriptional regulator YbjK
MAAVERRQPRGERRRQEILDAALRLIATRGLSAVTHRAVADEAGVPASSTTYYFESLDDLLDAALLSFVRTEAERLKAVTARLEGASVTPAELGGLLMAELRAGKEGDTQLEVAQFELYIEASRRPSLREAARECLDLYEEAAEAALRAAGALRPAEGAQAFVALIDGYGLHRIASGRDADLGRAMLELFIAHAMDDREWRSWVKRLGG